MRKILFSFFILFLSVFANAQDMKINGNVVDTLNNYPLRDAVVMAVRLSDSVLLDFRRTDYEGKFSFDNLPVTTVEIIISHPRFEEKSIFVIGTSGKKEFTIPNIVLPDQSDIFDEVIIIANTEPIYFRGDTLVYVADSFKVGENAVVEDLLKKLPGVEVDENGRITSQGKDVAKVLVDGDEFFGSDPTIATKNLAANGIESVEVYEKKNDNAKDGEDETIQVMDLKLKEDAKKGYFGRISGASDGGITIQGNPFYEGELLLNKFNGSQKISVFALGSNTPRSSFDWRDMNKFGLDNEEGTGNRWDPNAGGNAPSGIPQTLKAGIYYSDKFGKKKNTKVNFNYSYYNNELDAVSSSLSQYFLTDTSYYTDNSATKYTKNESHRINLILESKLDSLTTIEIKPNFTIDAATEENNSSAIYLTQAMSKTIETDVLNTNQSDGFTTDTKAKLDRKFRKERRALEVKYNFQMSDNKSFGSLNSTTSYYDTVNYTSVIDQQKTNVNSAQQHSGSVVFTEPLNKKIKMEFEYDYLHGLSDVSIESYNYNAINGEYSDFVTANSNIFNTIRQENKAGTKFIFESKKHTFKAGVFGRTITIDNHNEITDSTIAQNVSNLLPNMHYTFKPSRSKRVTLGYQTSSTLPSVSALQPVVNNTNPNQIAVGNPDLLPDYRHRINLNFNTWSALSGKYIWSGASFMIMNNAFANSTIYDEYGRTYTKTINVDGNQFANLFAGAGLPIYKNIIKINPNVNGSYNKYSGYINDERNITQNTSVSGGVRLELDLDSLDISIGNTYSYTDPVSSLSTGSNKPYSSQVYTANIKWILPHHFTIKSDVKYTMNAQLSKGYSLNYFIWNAELSRSFLKTENLILSLMGNDILNQNIIAQRQVNGNIITDNRTKIISRYLLLKLTLKFNNNRTTEKDPVGWH